MAGANGARSPPPRPPARPALLRSATTWGCGGQNLELGLEDTPQPLQRAAPRQCEDRQGGFELAGGLSEHRLEEAALRVVVVKEQLLVDPRAPGDLIYPGTREPALGELFPRRSANS